MNLTKNFALLAILMGATLLNSSAEARIINFYEIDTGKYFRSAQPSGSDIEEMAHRYGIKSVINLRGENPSEGWYQDEKAMVDNLGLNFVNISMSPSEIPHRKNLLQLLEALESLPRPILVHCQAGADRTGEASAIYQMIYMGKTKSEALSMLSMKYGHISFAKPAKDYFIKEVWQGRDWAYSDYKPCSGTYKYYNVQNPECEEDIF